MRASSSLISCASLAVALAASAREPANLDEAKKCVVFVATYDEDSKPYARATGFVMEENGVQWLYTNAHAIDGAKRIEFADSDGKVLVGFKRFACFAKGSGEAVLTKEDEKGKITFGEDGVRFELATKRDLAFAPAAAQPLPTGTAVVTLGDNDGDKILDVLEGTVSASSAKIIQSTCETRHGSSGGPLLNKADLKVVGLNTWGIPAGVKVADMLWSDQKSEGTAAATVLAGAKWIEMKTSDFLASGDAGAKFLNSVRALYLVYLLTPQESGFKIDPQKQVFGTEMTYADAFRLLGREAVLQPVISLNLKLAGRGNGGIGINNMELAKIYAGTLYEVRRSYAGQREAAIGKLAPYYVSKFGRSGLFKAGDWLSRELSKPQEWFASRTKNGASMPVGKWFNLRPLSDLGEQTF
ncbi:serine protease [Haloferula sp. BvORR071]|uniref:S1 family peptidase n=1 Tax=Haloferula sp. BvORR071 TaxID=1396141 RepID=UPI0009DE301B|nr:serine protease [Haloferula sp. BvORR071]